MAFGDYSRKVVAAECQCYRDQGYRKRDLKVLPMMDASGETIMRAIRTLNIATRDG